MWGFYYPSLVRYVEDEPYWMHSLGDKYQSTLGRKYSALSAHKGPLMMIPGLKAVTDTSHTSDRKVN